MAEYEGKETKREERLEEERKARKHEGKHRGGRRHGSKRQVPKDFKGVMHEWGQGALHSGSKKGKVVPHTKKGQKQAVAIAFSEQRQLNRGRSR